VSSVLHTVQTAALTIAYEQTGPSDAEPIVLLHGFPYDIRQFDEVRNCLADRGYRALSPYLRGFGSTQYRTPETFRSGQQAALGNDVVEFLDALRLEQAILVGFDWGSRAACVAAALWPARVRALVSIGGYAIQDIATAATTPESPEQERENWYQWYFQTERGRAGLGRNRRSFCELLWRLWSPNWQFAESVFAETARSFENADFVDTVIHSYRHRYANAPGDPALESLEQKLASKPKIRTPTITLQGDDDRVNPPSTSEGHEQQFTGFYERRVVPGVGHCLPAESPQSVTDAIEYVSKL
jgi:pimeloyl-ACP methyl ester carboxylesterase